MTFLLQLNLWSTLGEENNSHIKSSWILLAPKLASPHSFIVKCIERGGFCHKFTFFFNQKSPPASCVKMLLKTSRDYKCYIFFSIFFSYYSDWTMASLLFLEPILKWVRFVSLMVSMHGAVWWWFSILVDILWSFFSCCFVSIYLFACFLIRKNILLSRKILYIDLLTRLRNGENFIFWKKKTLNFNEKKKS